MRVRAIGTACFIVAATLAATANDDAGQPILPNLPSMPEHSVSTIPSNGDLNPYGVAFVPTGFPSGGPLQAGDILVSNFNDANNLQGTGRTIVRIDPAGHQSLFFRGSGELGLTTALAVLRGGFVLVGNMPTTTPSAACTAGPSGQEEGVAHGTLLVIDRHDRQVGEFSSERLLDGPWDLTVQDLGRTAHVFVANALSGAVTRIDLDVDEGSGRLTLLQKMTQIASGYVHRCDPNALVVGPTGLAFDAASDTLFVASTGDNEIFQVSRASTRAGDAGAGTVVVRDSRHLHGPLGLVRSPNGDLIAAQGDAVNPDPNHPSEIVEFTRAGRFVSEFSIDAAAGSAFGLALEELSDGFVFAAVDDGTNRLDAWRIK